jgi:hypothetical protein
MNSENIKKVTNEAIEHLADAQRSVNAISRSNGEVQGVLVPECIAHSQSLP